MKCSVLKTHLYPIPTAKGSGIMVEARGGGKIVRARGRE